MTIDTQQQHAARRQIILADPHPEQERRLQTLKSYGILDTAAETDFDDIVALASKICDMPVSLISLVDEDRQWFKASIGFDSAQTGLDESVCSHALLQDDFLEIEDMASDIRTADNPLYTQEPGVQYYAGFNLRAPNGLPIGTLCVLDTKPRKLTEFQRQALQTMSRQVMIQLELRKRLAQEESIRSEIDHRVKNSLQTIASVMRIAVRQITDPCALDVIALVERRLGAVASLHSELMGAEGQDSVDTRPYLKRVVALLDDIASENITLTVSVVDAVIDARKASALGMIVSEFVANSTKHAFPDGRQGEVEISLSKDADENSVLLCQDNGVGRQDTQDPAAPESTGLGQLLMSSAATQLSGQISYDSGPLGTTLTVNFGNDPN